MPKCELCGSPVKVVGQTTLHYEPVEAVAQNKAVATSFRDRRYMAAQNCRDPNSFALGWNVCAQAILALLESEEKFWNGTAAHSAGDVADWLRKKMEGK